jgi:transposase
MNSPVQERIMPIRQYKQGIARQQSFLLPARVEEYVAEDNPVRAIDVYVDSLDIHRLGFKNAIDSLTPGQPAYSPSDLLKLYLYGYLHRIRSSRRLEQETKRNLEVIWLVQGLRPSYKTIADFRKNNLKPLKKVNQDFVQLCKELDLFGGELVSIDGSYFRGNVSKGSIYMEEGLKKSLERIEKHIDEYLQVLEKADSEEAGQINEDQPSLQEKLAILKDRQQKHQMRLKKLQETGEKQLAEVDEDARLLSKNGQSIAGYNIQTAVDEKNKLLVICEVTQDGNDEEQLEPMAKKAKEVLEVEKLEVVADAGYFNLQGIKNCVEENITPYTPVPARTNQASLQGRFSREDFSYNEKTNSYTCPAGKELCYQGTRLDHGKVILNYISSTSICALCPLKGQCLPPKSPRRQISRWEHERFIEAHRERMAQKGRVMMRKRSSLSEHPFGTLKQWCGWTHFLLRGLEKVSAEMSLLMLCYNFKRVLNILGLDGWRTYCLQRAKT